MARLMVVAVVLLGVLLSCWGSAARPVSTADVPGDNVAEERAKLERLLNLLTPQNRAPAPGPSWPGPSWPGPSQTGPMWVIDCRGGGPAIYRTENWGMVGGVWTYKCFPGFDSFRR